MGASIEDGSRKGLNGSGSAVVYEELLSEWPQGPQKIAPKGYTWWIGTIGDVILTITPVAFFVMAALAIQLERQPMDHDTRGHDLIEALKLAPTIYPIVFAAVAGRFYKTLALWSVTRSRGVSVGALEQMLGSQSFAGSLFRLFSVRSHVGVGLIIILTWALSPLGGQSSSRLLFKTVEISDSEVIAYYSSTDSLSSMNSASGDQVTSTGANSLFTSSLMAGEEQRRSMADLWGRPRIPRLQDPSTDNWQTVHQADMTEADYAFLIGIKVLGLPNLNSTTSYSLAAEASYNDLDCNFVIRTLPSNKTPAYIPENRWTIPSLYRDIVNGTNKTQIWLPGSGSPGSFFLISDFLAPERQAGGHLHLLFGSHEGEHNYTLYNCTVRNVPLELDIACSSPFGCGVQRYRRSKAPQWNEGDVHSPFTLAIPVIANVLRHFPTATGVLESGSPRYQTTIDNYLRGVTQFPFKVHYLSPWPTNITDEAFSRRLTLLFNTYYYASLDPFTATDSSYAKYPGEDDDIRSQPVYPDSSNGHFGGSTMVMVADAKEITRRELYGLNRHWVAILLLCTTVLETLALVGLFLRLTTPAPDIFDYGASLTRENPFVPVPNGGSAIGGAERARMLRKMRVKMADVKPDEQVGYVALVGTTGELDQGVKAHGEVIPTRALSRWRRYW
ncbi:unnamed protein product [Sordaria macrospora k-hell]|uniref:WGS project CABT00000000 data, contig 2.10 n=2 Tax=Sordaria macrospora TaxID=5147 RepID=F7VWM8_SORMK|nr:uncharacterized protein SMAC_03352 [Sordaria macrospora k-hell]CCC09796.1 unnamed protein product [Sordaria macrospora k-hell]